MGIPGMQGLSVSAGSAVRVSFIPIMMPVCIERPDWDSWHAGVERVSRVNSEG